MTGSRRHGEADWALTLPKLTVMWGFNVMTNWILLTDPPILQNHQYQIAISCSNYSLIRTLPPLFSSNTHAHTDWRSEKAGNACLRPEKIPGKQRDKKTSSICWAGQLFPQQKDHLGGSPYSIMVRFPERMTFCWAAHVPLGPHCISVKKAESNGQALWLESAELTNYTCTVRA